MRIGNNYDMNSVVMFWIERSKRRKQNEIQTIPNQAQQRQRKLKTRKFVRQ